MEPQCNGAGEMPGQEGKGSYDEDYEHFIETNQTIIIEKYSQHIIDEDDIEQIPQIFIDVEYQIWKDNKNLEE